MESFQHALALVILSFWCATASPTSNGTVPPFSIEPKGSTEPLVSNFSVPPFTIGPRNSELLVDHFNVDRQTGAVPCGNYTLSTGQTVTIQSPNYPNLYPRNNNCVWNFKDADPASTISMTCSSFRLSSCTYSYMTITGQGLSKKYCGAKSTFTEVSGNNEMKVLFFSSGARNYGFSCKVSSLGSNTTTTNTTTTSTTTTSTTTSTTTTPPAAAVQCRCGRRNPITRIVGGQPTTMHEYPWQVALTSTTGTRPYCGGSIISDQYILTAAHCVSGSQPSSVIVVIGEHIWNTTTETNVTQRRTVSQIIVHSGYNSNTQDNDIALIKLSSQITFPADNKIAPVCLRDAGSSYDNVTATVTGWGTTTSGGSQPVNLYEVDLPTMTNSQCQNYYGSSITANMICAGLAAGGRDSCQGDSGGPLVTYGNTAQTYMVLIGIVSWGNGCALPNYPGVYTRVNRYLSWISTNTAGSVYCPRP